MLQQAADVPTGGLGQVGVGAVAPHQGVAVLPDALVDVHAAAVVGKDRLGHERGSFAVLLGNVAHDVLVDHHVVGRGDQLGEFHTELVLRGGHLVVVLLNGNPQGAHGEEHLGPHVLKGVVGGDGEVALLQLDFVGEVSTLLNTIGVPGVLDRVNAVEARAVGALVADVVKNEELGLWSEVRRVGKTGGAQIVQGLLSQGPRAAGVGLAAAGLLNRADQAEGLVAVEGVDPGGVRVGHHGHVRLVDGFPAADRGAIKGHALGEGFLFHQVRGDREVLPLPVEINELQVDQFNAFVLDLTEDVLGGLGHDALKVAGWVPAYTGRE